MGSPRSGKRKTCQPNSVNDRPFPLLVSRCTKEMKYFSSRQCCPPVVISICTASRRSNKLRKTDISSEVSCEVFFFVPALYLVQPLTNLSEFSCEVFVYVPGVYLDQPPTNLSEFSCEVFVYVPGVYLDQPPTNSGDNTDHSNSKEFAICAGRAPVCESVIKNPCPDNLGHHAMLTSAGLSNKAQMSAPEDECIWDSVPADIQGLVLEKLEYEDMSRVKIVSPEMKKLIESAHFRDCVPELGCLTSLYLYTKNGALQWSGYDIVSKKWRPLPTLGCLLPSPGPDYLFKEYLFAAGGGLVCANISKSPDSEEIVVCNPMTRTTTTLPRLNSPRNPVLMHILVDPSTKAYKVIVAGSSGMTKGHLSKETEVFDSRTSKWTKAGDLPGPDFGLNEYQTGVCINGILYCVAFLEDGSGKGLAAYDVEGGNWLTNWTCPLPCLGSPANSLSVAQVVECDGEVYLFSEHEIGNVVEHRIDKMERCTSFGRWKNVVRERKSGGRGLLVYPEHSCVRFGEGKLCVFNTLELTGKVYDVRNGGRHSEPLTAPSPEKRHKGGGAELFHTLNPLSFTFQPNFQDPPLLHIPP